MPPCHATLRDRKVLCKGTAALYLERPDGFEFKAGQFANFTLLLPIATDPGGSTRSLSIASAPYEKHLMFAMRIRSTGFKGAVNTLPIGSPILLQGPFGNFILHKDAARPAVFIAGGIGITPFRSMIWQATQSQSPHRIFLFYSNRRLEEAAFHEELQEIEKLNARFKLIATLTQPGETPSEWRGETGYISEPMLRKWLPDLRAPIYYVAGPPPMVTGISCTFSAAGVSDDDIRAEEFAGY